MESPLALLFGAGAMEDDLFINLTTLFTCLLNNNDFSGQLPRSISAMTSLQTLQLQHNRFTGNLDGVFNATSQRILTVVQLS